jgi:uroporphyrin-III C-methyltransferase/precorrin-2 dehydrogenase/sirohydrochlorin ferrochelatase
VARTERAARGIPYFAAFLDLVGKRVLVVGGGRVAASKVRALLPCQPRELIVVAPNATPGIRKAAANAELIWLARDYVQSDLTADTTLAFGATDDAALNAAVASDARALGVPVLAVDDVPNCDFIAPALVRRGDVTIAISTAGRSPAMARRTRELLERLVPPYWGDLLSVAAQARERLGATRGLIEPDRWQAALQGEVERLVEAGALEAATAHLVRQLEHSLFEAAPSDTNAHLGAVALVGAGPGDPELLTLRAVDRLRAADVVVHDRLVSDEVLAYANPHAERIDVGKAPGGHGWTQTEINDLLVRLGRDGRRVVRLKGGDPFVFGRGGEELLALREAGVSCEVVPGVSSAMAAPAAAGIPVTHRGLSASVTVVEGHDPRRLAAPTSGTLVCLMAVEHLERLTASLIVDGRPSDEPAALIQWATTSRQRAVVSTLGAIAAEARAAGIGAPAVLVVGPTAAFGEAQASVLNRERNLAYT